MAARRSGHNESSRHSSLTSTNNQPMDSSNHEAQPMDCSDAAEAGERAVNIESAPWSFLLATHLPFGAVEWWEPKDMILLRSTCKALRTTCSTSELLFEVLTAGLGVPENIWKAITRDVELYHTCRIIYAERLLITTLPRVAAEAAGISSSDERAAWCAIVAGSFGLHRYLRDVNGVRMDEDHWDPLDVDVFIPFGEARDADQEERARSGRVEMAVRNHIPSRGMLWVAC